MTKTARRVRKAVLPAAGLGTRFLPATKAQPKEMLPVVDKPLIQYVVEECVASGIENIIIVTGRGKNAIEDHFDSSPELERFLESKGKTDQAELVRDISNMVHFSYTRQKEPLGLGHAVLDGARTGGRRTICRAAGRRHHSRAAAGDARAHRDLRSDGHRRDRRGSCSAGKNQPVRYRSTANRRSKPSWGDIFCASATWSRNPVPTEAPSNLAVTGRYVLPPKSSIAWSARKPEAAARYS